MKHGDVSPSENRSVSAQHATSDSKSLLATLRTDAPLFKKVETLPWRRATPAFAALSTQSNFPIFRAHFTRDPTKRAFRTRDKRRRFLRAIRSLIPFHIPIESVCKDFSGKLLSDAERDKLAQLYWNRRSRKSLDNRLRESASHALFQRACGSQ
jgi:hypothetical protein